jgi:hypothetical protein
MRIHLLSDLPLEFEPFEPFIIDADVVLLAGDIHSKGEASTGPPRLSPALFSTSLGIMSTTPDTSSPH